MQQNTMIFKKIFFFFFCTFCLLHHEYRLGLKRENCKCGHTLVALLLGDADWSVGTLASFQHPPSMAPGAATTTSPLHHCIIGSINNDQNEVICEYTLIAV